MSNDVMSLASVKLFAVIFCLMDELYTYPFPSVIFLPV